MLEHVGLGLLDVALALLIAALGVALCQAWLLKCPLRDNLTNWPVLGMLPGLLLNLHHVHEWLACLLVNNGGSFTFQGPWFSGMRGFVTADPRNIEHALRTNFPNYPKGTDFSDMFHDLLGHGIFNADGHLWKMQRKMISLQFHSRLFKQFSDSTVFEMAEDKLLPTLQHFCATGSRVDIQDIMLRFTFDTICLLAFGVDTGCLCPSLPAVPFAKAFETSLECTMLRFFLPPRWWKVVKWLRCGKEQRMPDALRVVNGFCEDVIFAKKEQLLHENGLSQSKPDLLSCFLRMDGDNRVDEKLLRDLALNLLLAGRDTSAIAISWFFWLLAKHPNVEQRVAEEVRHIVGTAKKDGKRILTRTELNQMHYLHAALTESLRLYPSVPIEFKHIVADDMLPDGTHVRKGGKFVYDIYAMGRMESIWGSDRSSFRPERWLNPHHGTFTDAHILPFHLIAFNAGPRTCLGKDMAYMLMKTVASTLLYHFKIMLVPGHKVAPKLSVTLYMKDGLLVTLERRVAYLENDEIQAEA